MNIPTGGLMLGFQLMSIVAILVSVFLKNWAFFTVAMVLVAGTLIGSYFVPKKCCGTDNHKSGTTHYSKAPQSARHLQQDGKDNFENDMWQGEVPSDRATRPARPRPAPAASLPQRKGYETHMYNQFSYPDQAAAAYNAPYGIEVETPPPEDVNAFQAMMMRGKLGGNNEYMQEIFD
jgi:hypothetical protein